MLLGLFSVIHSVGGCGVRLESACVEHEQVVSET